MAGIFISYRRDDTAPYAGRLFDRLTREFADDVVFMDIDNIEPGDDFIDVIDSRLRSCQVVLALIGPDWLSRDDKSGRRRIDHPDDFVRMELTRALQQRVRVIPVLVGDAQMPASAELPDDLKPLTRRHAVEISDSRFHTDALRLIERLRKDIASVAATPPASLPSDSSEAHAEAPAPAVGTAAAPAPRKRIAWAIGAVVVVGLAAGFWAIKQFGPGRDVEVPSLVKQGLEDARVTLQAKGLVLGQVRNAETDALPEGAVTDQQPAAGEVVKPGTAVDVVLAQRPKVGVPKLVGLMFNEAQTAARQAGLTIEELDSKPAAEVARARVVSQTPNPGERVVKGSRVGVLVGAPAPVQVAAPDLRGMSRADAKAALERAGLRLGRVEHQIVGDSIEGVVSAQSPRAGERADSGTAVDLTIAIAANVLTPDLSGMTLARARATLEKAGLTLGDVGGEQSTDATKVVVRSQEPKAGTALRPKSRVDLVVAARPAATGAMIPNFVGTPWSKVREWLRERGHTKVSTKPVYDDRVPAGQVTSQSPLHPTLIDSSTALSFEYAVWYREVQLSRLFKLGDAEAARDTATATCGSACAAAGGKWTGKHRLADSQVRCGCDFYNPPTGNVMPVTGSASR